jgi:hypothetical protein
LYELYSKQLNSIKKDYSRVDIIHLYNNFKLFSTTELIGVANDQTPHYFQVSRNFAKQNPGSLVGNPGKFQVIGSEQSSD